MIKILRTIGPEKLIGNLMRECIRCHLVSDIVYHDLCYYCLFTQNKICVNIINERERNARCGLKSRN